MSTLTLNAKARFSGLIIVVVCAVAVVLLTKGKLGYAPNKDESEHRVEVDSINIYLEQ